MIFTYKPMVVNIQVIILAIKMEGKEEEEEEKEIERDVRERERGTEGIPIPRHSGQRLGHHLLHQMPSGECPGLRRRALLCTLPHRGITVMSLGFKSVRDISHHILCPRLAAARSKLAKYIDIPRWWERPGYVQMGREGLCDYSVVVIGSRTMRRASATWWVGWMRRVFTCTTMLFEKSSFPTWYNIAV